MFRAVLVATLAMPTVAKVPRNLILGGEETQPNKYPYYSEVKPDRENVCGGTLVAPDMVLSHPQCEPVIDEVKVGWYNQNQEESMDILSMLDDNSLFRHPLYDESTFEYGFLLIKLSGTSSKEIARLNDDPAVPTTSTPLNVVGRGSQKASSIGRPQSTLTEASLPLIENDTCELFRAHGGWNYKDVIGNSLLCAGSSDYSACENDWGGPLVETSSSSTDVLVGVFSWTFGCDGDTPAVFSRVSAGYDWLRYTICEHSTQPPSYLDCAGATEPQLSSPQASPEPSPSITLKWTFTPDDFNHENAYTLERIEGFEVTKVDFMVPGAIPYGFSTTYEREVNLQTGALYAWTISDTRSNGLELDSGGSELFLANQNGNYEKIHDEDESFTTMFHMFYATLDESSIDSPFDGGNKFSNSTTFLRMTVQFDDYPEEFGWQATTEAGDVVAYRPPRYYFGKVKDSDSVDFRVPEEETKFTLRVVDTYGDGLLGSSTSYKITDAGGEVLVESQFRSGAEETKTFTYPDKGSGAAPGFSFAVALIGSAVGMLFCL